MRLLQARNRPKGTMTTGKQIVLTAPLTEMLDHAGYFIQMGVASLPSWMEWIFKRKYPEWKHVKRYPDDTARVAHDVDDR